MQACMMQSPSNQLQALGTDSSAFQLLRSPLDILATSWGQIQRWSVASCYVLHATISGNDQLHPSVTPSRPLAEWTGLLLLTTTLTATIAYIADCTDCMLPGQSMHAMQCIADETRVQEQEIHERFHDTDHASRHKANYHMYN
jgi:hypothetical protein